ncbi:MAG: Gfo/Idh/MocA family oxidoreductase [Parcubacteria group bacterium]|nr:Gfo/Idh/MocA family oxidoreductase [Parcubacteria group bacterium]
MSKRNIKNKYRAAVIGCGRIGLFDELDSLKLRPASHVGAFLRNRRIELAAICDSDAAILNKAKRFLPRVNAYRDVYKMLECERPDIVSIATPDETHLSMARAAVDGGAKLIICEKPLAPDFVSGKKIIALCHRRGAKLLVNHMRRFDPLLRKTISDIRRGKYGRVRQTRALYVNGWLNSGTHLIDILRWSLGEILWVAGFKHEKLSFIHQDDFNIDVVLETRNGARVFLQPLEKKDYGIFEIEFYCERGMVAVRDLGFAVEVTPLVRSRRYSGTMALDTDNKKVRKNESVSFMASMAKHAVEALDGRQKILATGEDALAALRIIEAARKSAKSDGKKIYLK